MAAPDSKTVLNMTGVWQINRTLSDDINQMFVLQGIPWLLRKLIAFTTVQLSMKQGTLSPSGGSSESTVEIPITTIHVTQTVSPGNFNSEDTYILDSVPREATVPIFGRISVMAKHVLVASIEDPETRARFEKNGLQTAIVDKVKSLGNGWSTESVWGFEEIDGNRYHTRHSVTKKGSQELKMRVFYDFIREI